MKVEIKEDKIIIQRNKKKVIELKVIRITGEDWTVCDKCCLSCYTNSFCNPPSFYLCEEVKNRGLGNYYFKM